MDDDVQQQTPPMESPIGEAPSSRLRAPRWMLALLVILAVLLLITTSALVFGPSIGLLHFGSASNQGPSGQNSTRSFGAPSPLPASPSASQTATRAPLAGQTPTSSQPTATPTPTVIPSGAVVTFTARTASISKKSFTGCASGCDFATANGTGNGSLASGASYGPSGWQSTEVAGPYNVTLQWEKYCYEPLPGSDYKCVSASTTWNPNSYGNPKFTLQSSNFSCSGITIPSVGMGGTVHSSWCWWPTTQNPVAANRFCGTTSYQSPLASDQSFHIYGFSFCNAQWKSVQHYTYVTSSDCDNAISSADPKAKSAAISAASSWTAGRVSLYQNLAPINTSSVRYCSPGVNARNTSTTGHAEWSWSATVFDPNLVVSAAGTYVRGHTPAGYTSLGVIVVQ